MHVPLKLSARREFGVGGGEQEGGEGGRDEGIESSEKYVAEEDLVNMQREGMEVKEVGEGLNCVAQEGWNWNRVQHRIVAELRASKDVLANKMEILGGTLH